MSFCFSVSWTSNEEDVLSSWGNLSQLIKSKALSLSSSDSLSGFSGELKSTNSKSFRNVQKSDVVSDGTNNGENSWVELGLSFWDWGIIMRKGSSDSWDGDWISVESWLIESFVNGFVEVWLSSSIKERVKLNQSFNICVGCLGFSDASVGDSSSSD